jgi:hypothetical protein
VVSTRRPAILFQSTLSARILDVRVKLSTKTDMVSVVIEVSLELGRQVSQKKNQQNYFRKETKSRVVCLNISAGLL